MSDCAVNCGHTAAPILLNLMTLRKSILLLPAACGLFLSSCAGLPGESPDEMRARVDRQDKWYDARQEKRQIRTETADRRYDKWWDNAMGRSDSNSW